MIDWDARFPDCPPIGHELRSRLHDRWLRFHTLPFGKRYADDDAQYAEIMRRHDAVLAELGAEGVLVVTCAYADEPRDVRLPKATYWRTVDGDACAIHLHLTSMHARALHPLLRLVADDETRGVIVMPLDLAWLYHPYDGGADVIARSGPDRGRLRAKFRAWRP